MSFVCTLGVPEPAEPDIDFEAALAGALVTLASPEIAAAWAAIADLRFAAWFL